MRQLIKVRAALEPIEKPLDEPRRRKFALGSMAAGLASALLMAASCVYGSNAAALVFGTFAFFCSVLLPLALVNEEPLAFLLPPAARRFRRETRGERRELVRRTEAFNRAWCLAERARRALPEGGADPFQSGYEALNADVEAYVARYRAAVADDLASVGSAVAPRHAVRGAIVRRSMDLVELEDKLDDLGSDADPAMRAHARELREKLEADCKAANLPLGIVRRRRPPSLPSARLVSS
ncbi:MAG TPA: hypothetical protein VJ694_01160 [Patescibacteria group bacterium]|nr:hypothetical protein [Patescibacteria group bacterium]